MLYDSLMLLTDQTNANIKYYPKASAALKDFKDCTFLFADLPDSLKDYFLKIDGELIKLCDLNTNKDYPMILSPIYKNHYYLAEYFEKCFKEDLKEIAIRILYYMGAKSCKVNIEKEKTQEQKTSKETEINTKANIPEYGSYDLGAKFSDNSQEKFYLKEKININHTSKNGITRKKLKDEFNKWIEQEHINIKAFPSELKILIETYMENGVINGQIDFSRKEEIYKSIETQKNKAANLNISILQLPEKIKFRSAGGDVNIKHNQYQSKQDTENKYISWSVNFGENN
ncbi:TPA: hypothetical protein SB542_000460 [Campylobacter jejuni]|nr:hypothetical protein [Campylobacter jejuni]